MWLNYRFSCIFFCTGGLGGIGMGLGPGGQPINANRLGGGGGMGSMGPGGQSALIFFMNVIVYRCTSSCCIQGSCIIHPPQIYRLYIHRHCMIDTQPSLIK